MCLSLQMIVVALDPETEMIEGGQGPDLVIARGGGHVIEMVTGVDHAPGHMIVTMTEGGLVPGLESVITSQYIESFLYTALYHHNFCVQLVIDFLINIPIIPFIIIMHYCCIIHYVSLLIL